MCHWSIFQLAVLSCKLLESCFGTLLVNQQTPLPPTFVLPTLQPTVVPQVQVFVPAISADENDGEGGNERKSNVCDESLSGTKDEDYRGCQSTTRSGKTCQKWTRQAPHNHTNTPQSISRKGLGDHNYCRNPDGKATIWCYTAEPHTRWELCDPVPLDAGLFAKRQIDPFVVAPARSLASSKCRDFISTPNAWLDNCKWTLEWSCPGQPKSDSWKGYAGDDGTTGYICCCLEGLWQGPQEYRVAGGGGECKRWGLQAVSGEAECWSACKAVGYDSSFNVGSWDDSPGCFAAVSGERQGSCHWNTNLAASIHPIRERAICLQAALVTKGTYVICSSVTGAMSSTYPCKCGTSDAAATTCTDTSPLCTASNDKDGVCKVPICSSVVGARSSTYPCKCGLSDAAVATCKDTAPLCVASNDQNGVCETYTCTEGRQGALGQLGQLGQQGSGCKTCRPEAERRVVNHCATCNHGLVLDGPICRKVTYEGCFKNNEGVNRIVGAVSFKSIPECRALAERRGYSYFGMEYPACCLEAGYAECLILDGPPALPRDSDSECEGEGLVDGFRLGQAFRLALYSFQAFEVTTFDGWCRYGTHEKRVIRMLDAENVDACRLACAGEERCTYYAYEANRSGMDCDLYSEGPYTHGTGHARTTCYRAMPKTCKLSDSVAITVDCFCGMHQRYCKAGRFCWSDNTTCDVVPRINTNKNIVSFGQAGHNGGSCTCPDGQVYQVGDYDLCSSLACHGGIAGKCNVHRGEWSHRKVQCGQEFHCFGPSGQCFFCDVSKDSTCASSYALQQGDAISLLSDFKTFCSSRELLGRALASSCKAYMTSSGCSWTLQWSCPGQPKSDSWQGSAGDDGSLGYDCCCRQGFWQSPPESSTEVPTEPPTSFPTEVRETPSESPTSSSTDAPTEEHFASSCKAYMTSSDCSWTLQWSCPGQPKSDSWQGSAGDDGSLGYECCCRQGFWQSPPESSTEAPTQPPTSFPTEVREAPSESPTSSSTDAPTEGLFASRCRAYMTSSDCSWTLQWSCPGQPKSDSWQGSAGDDGSLGYECCCRQGFWQRPPESSTEVPTEPPTLFPTEAREAPTESPTSSSAEFAISSGGCPTAECAVPMALGYNTAKAGGDLTLAGFNPNGVTCAVGYTGTVTYEACKTPGAPFAVAGCYRSCSVPSAMGYNFTYAGGVTTVNGFAPIGVTCAVGYTGIVQYSVCSGIELVYSVSGCRLWGCDRTICETCAASLSRTSDATCETCYPAYKLSGTSCVLRSWYGLVHFTKKTYEVREDENIIFIPLIRGSYLQGKLIVTIQVLSHGTTATKNEDFKFKAVNVSWEDGDTSWKAFPIEIINDGLSEFPDENIKLSIIAVYASDPGSINGMIRLQVPESSNDSACTIVIKDDGDGGRFRFNQTSAEIDEHDLTPRCITWVDRFDGHNGFATIDVVTSTCASGAGGTIGKDFNFTGGSVTWSPEESDTKCGLYLVARVEQGGTANVPRLVVHTNAVAEPHGAACFTLRHRQPESIEKASSTLSVKIYDAGGCQKNAKPKPDFNDRPPEEACVCREGFEPSLNGECVSCSPGKYSGLDLRRCAACPSGSYSAEESATACQKCGPGRHQKNEGSTNCESCPVGKYMSEANASKCNRCPGFTGFMTTSQKASDTVTDCKCMMQTRLENGECIRCGTEGLDCRGGGGLNSADLILLKPGYTSDTTLSVYQCFGDPRRCPGGPPGASCAKGRKGIACALCEDMKTAGRDGECVACGRGDLAPFIVSVILAIALISTMYLSILRYNPVKQNPTSVCCCMILGQFVTAIQQFVVMSKISVIFHHPLPTFFSILAVLSLDVDLIRPGCVVGGINELMMFLAQASIIYCGLILVTFLHVVHVLVFKRGRLRAEQHVLVACAGLLGMTFFIAVIVAVLSPLQCNQNPNGKWTMRSLESVLCFSDEGDSNHSSMIVLSLALVSAPLGFLALVIRAVVRFPMRMSIGDAKFVKEFGFLFFRFRPEKYWFILAVVFKSLVVGLVPAIPHPMLQISSMQLCLVIYVCIVVYFQPWRTPLASFSDCLLSVTTLLSVNLCAFFAKPDSNLNILSWACVAMVIFIIAFIACTLCKLAYDRFGLVAKTYGFFLCHYKANAGAFARLLKTALSSHAKLKARVFLDSDNLIDLCSLFDIVKTQVETVLVIKSKNVFTRAWCLGEMVTAHVNNIDCMPLAMPSQDALTDKYIESVTFDINVLAENNISKDMVKSALRWIANLPCVEAPVCLSREKLVQLIAEVLKHNFEKRASQNEKDKMNRGSVQECEKWLLADHSNPEATASALILVILMTPLANTIGQVPKMLEQNDNPKVMIGAGAVLLVCSGGCFFQERLLLSIEYVAKREMGVYCVVIEENFRFPTKQSIDQWLLPSFKHQRTTVRFILAIFKKIAPAFYAAHASEDMLALVAREVHNRVENEAVGKVFTSAITDDADDAEVAADDEEDTFLVL